MTEGKAKMSSGKKIMIALIIALAVMTAAVYYFGVNYFTNHFLPGSMVNGFNCSYMDINETEQLLSERIGSYVLTIDTRNNGQESITADQAGLTYQSDGSVKKLLLNQNRYKWFMAFNQQQTYEIPSSIVFEQNQMESAVKGLKCMQPENTVMPEDAYIKETEDGFEIVPEEEGNALKPDKVLELVEKASTTGVTELNLEEEDCYKAPAVYQNDEGLIRNCEQANRLTDVIITYDFADQTEVVDRDVIKSWLIKDENGDYVLDKEQITDFVRELGNKYDTLGKTRTFLTYDGREKTIDGGDYGWVIDQDKEAQELTEAITRGETQVREPVYLQEGWSRDTRNDIGYTYLEIDLTSQRMVYYQSGQPVVDTPVVTGNPNLPGAETPVGCFALKEMQSPAVITGNDYQIQVNYWMPFAGSTGICDASWRTEFGGNLYMLEGSYGSVDTPLDAVQSIYGSVSAGIPVVVYK